jgi:peroxiredoxin
MVDAMTDKKKTGENSVDFSLNDQNGKTFRLSEHLGKKVLLSFHPLAWTSVCAKQMRSLEDNKANFSSLNCIAVGISVDSVPCKKAWAESLGIVDTPILADFWPHGRVAQLYGILREKEGFSERANILVDELGLISFSKIYELKQLPEIEEVLDVLKR